MTYVTDHMKRELSGHVLESAKGSNVDALAYRMIKPGTNIYSAYISEIANRLCITGDVCLGANDCGIVSMAGYSMAWFGGRLSEEYLCSKFLRHEWQWESAVKQMRWQIEEATKDGEGWWLDNADELNKFIKSPNWKYDVPNLTEFYEFMGEIDRDCCELPGEDYPLREAGWLCAIQQRFFELNRGDE